MLNVNHPFQAQRDVINECREDGKTSPSTGINNFGLEKENSHIAGKCQNDMQTKVTRPQLSFMLII